MGRRNDDAKLAKVAARQLGVFTRAQALELGFTEAGIRHRLHTGRWSRIEPGTYAIAGAPATLHQRIVAACVAAGEGAAVSHLTAAALYGLVEHMPDTVHVTVAHDQHHGRNPTRIVHRARTFGPRDKRMIGAIVVTCVARVLVDVAGLLPPKRLEDAVDTALDRGLVTINRLRRYIIERNLGHLRGVGYLMRLLDDREFGVPQKELERAYLRIVRDHRLPKPARQYPQGRRKIDFAHPQEKVAIELDGYRYHRSRRRFRDDRVRQNELVLAGWLVLRFTWDDLTEHPGKVAAAVRQALRARAAA